MSKKNKNQEQNHNKKIEDEQIARNATLFHKAMFLLAKEEAKKSPCRCKHGAIIVKGNQIIATGYNRYLQKNHSQLKNWKDYAKPTIHAEVDCLNNCHRDLLRGADLYVIRLNLNEEKLSYSAPCKKCSKILNKRIEKNGLNKVYYSTDNICL